MDPRLSPGFLGTGASLAADLSLLAYIVLFVPGMLVGFSFARRHLFVPHHKLTMTTITLVNWGIILYLMLTSYRLGVAPNVPAGLNQAGNLIPTIHLITGGIAQLIATVLVIRMWFENVLPRSLRFEPIKPWMRLTLGLWLVTAALGIGIYVTWNVLKLPPRPADNGTPAITATEQATPDGAADPAATADAAATPDAAATDPASAATADAAATAAPEAATPDAAATAAPTSDATPESSGPATGEATPAQ
jgi:uncharacterized membrane protein YozB (DUF420 family)